MNPCIKKWLWFVGLWCGGLLSVTILALLIRTIMGIN